MFVGPVAHHTAILIMIQLLKKLFKLPIRERSCFGRTDTGKVRDHNEDNFSILKERQLFIVADGMGGHKAGEVASRVAIESLIDFLTPAKIRGITGNPEAIRHSLIAGFHHANDSVVNMAAEDSALEGMGSTLVACLIGKNTMHTCHVGDSRCYLFDNQGGLGQITTDHTCSATVNNKQGEAIPRQVLSRAIGFSFTQDPEYHATAIQPGNKVLLCSDGLWSMLDDRQIEKILKESASPEEACDVLVHKGNEAGGKDNITALVIFC